MVLPVPVFPQEWSFCRNENNKVAVEWTDAAYKVRNIIYLIESNHKAIVGESGNDFITRINGYCTKANGKKKRGALSKDLSKNPSKFTVTVLEEIKPGVDRKVREEFWRAHMKTEKALYNQRAGGGGGRPFSSPNAKTGKNVPDIDYSILTPEKDVQFSINSKGKICINRKQLRKITEGALDGGIYRIKRLSDGTTYYGMSGRPLDKRGGEWASMCNNPDLYPSELNAAIREDPSDFTMGPVYLGKDGDNLPEIERRVIAAALRKLWNKNGGGGGGAPSKKRKQIEDKENLDPKPKTRTLQRTLCSDLSKLTL